MKHTETPWEVQSVEHGAVVTDDWCILGPSPNFRAVATLDRCYQGDRIPEMEKANAEFIVEACNSHAQLLVFVVSQAGFEDYAACRYLANTGGYGGFDNPKGVRKARELLTTLGYSVCPACKGIGGFAEHDHMGGISGVMCDTCEGKGVVS